MCATQNLSTTKTQTTLQAVALTSQLAFNSCFGAKTKLHPVTHFCNNFLKFRSHIPLNNYIGVERRFL